MATYIVRAGESGPVKIGRADDVEARIRDLQTGHYEPLTVLRVIDTPVEAEGIFHRHFAAHRLRGEWFHFVPEMLTFTPREVSLPTLGHEPAVPSEIIFDAIRAEWGGRRADLVRDVGCGRGTARHWLAGKSMPQGEHLIKMMALSEHVFLAVETLRNWPPGLPLTRSRVQRAMAIVREAKQ